MNAQPAEAMTLLEIGDLVFRFGLATIFSIAIVIIIHEFGHYLAARYIGVKITKFSIGFGKEIYGWTDKLGTRWSLSRIPIGGYVSIFGDVDPGNPVIWDTKQDRERTLTKEELDVAFCTKKVWQRMLIVAAGPGINVLLALTLLAGTYMIKGIQINPPIIRGLAIGTAAYDAGFSLGDRIIEMDGKKIDDFMDVYKITVEDWINPHEYKVLRDGKEVMITMTAREVNHTDFKGRKWTERGRTGMVNGVATKFDEIITIDGVDTKDAPDQARQLIIKNFDKVIKVEYELTDEDRDVFLAVFPSEVNTHLDDPENRFYDRAFLTDHEKIEFKRLDPFTAYWRAGKQIYNGIITTAGLIAVLHKGRTEQPGVGGIIRVGGFVGSAVKEGWRDYVRILTILSMGIALMNILPIPLLDGGFMVFLIYEGLTGNRVSPRVQNLSFVIALVFLAGIMIIANLFDLIYLVTKDFRS